MIGESIAHYRITAKLGEGGMGVVYRATDTRLDRDVAIKVLPPDVAKEPDRLARFEREAKTLASLNHPNIAAIYGVEQGALVMELVEGPTLAERLETGALPVDEAIAIAKQIADALEAAHEKGVVHRDLKPANVKITPDGKVKLLDFGLAKAMETAKQVAGDPENSPTVVNASIAGVIMGTPGYMAPEQAKGQPVDRRADIWAFGVVFHEMLTGRQLFDSGSIAQAIADVLRADIDLNALPALTPPAVRALLKRCLDRNVKTRLRDIGEARIALDAPPAPADPAVTPMPVVPARRTVWPWLCAAVFAAGIPLAWFLKPIPEAPLLQVEILPPPGVSMGPSNYAQLQVSPDGSMIVFVARDRDGRNKLFLRDLHSGSTIAAPGSENGRAPFWSPDSRQIAFLSDSRLKRLELAGNRILDICEAPTGSYAMWHSDGYIYLSTAEHILRKVQAAGGTLAPVFPASQQDSVLGATPATIPGEASFLYQILGSPAKIVLMTGDGTIRKWLLPNATSSGSPASFAANPAGGGWLLHNTPTRQLGAIPFDPRAGVFRGESVIIAHDVPAGPSWSTSNNGVLAYRKAGWGADRKLTWVDRNGSPGASIGEQGNVFTQRIAPDQKSVVFTRITENGTFVFLYDLARDTTTRVSVESRHNSHAEWMPDGKSVVYSVGRQALAQHGLHGAGGERILQKTGGLVLTGISRDGKWLASVSIVVGSPRLVLVSLETGKNIQLGEDMRLPTHHGSFSPDGRWLLYSALVNGRWDVFVRPVPPQVLGQAANASAESFGQLQISPAGGNQPMWRSDGREIFYIAAGGMLTAVPVEIGPANVRPGTPEPLFQTTLGMDTNFQREYDATADGKRFLLPLQPTGTQSEVPITVIFNWPKLLEKK